MKGFTAFAILLVVASASIHLVMSGGDSFPVKPDPVPVVDVPVTDTPFEEFTMPIDFTINEKVPSTASGRPCPSCLPGRLETPFDEWAAKHLERAGPASGSCGPNREKFIFKGDPDKCCCEMIASP